MIKVTIIAVGKIKEKEFSALADEYIKRLSAFCDLKVIELKPEPLPESPNPAQIKSALLKEAGEILSKIPKDAQVFPLCIEGKQFSSEEFSKEIKICADNGKNICFLIGGSHGLDQSIKKNGIKVSFSAMTFPHKLFRIMLLEQLYRGFSIINGGKYHK